MNILKNTTKFFGLSDERWMQHSNPWSVWTRLVILPLLALAVWSHVWIGWYSLVPVALLLFWTWINPRFFNKPKTTKLYHAVVLNTDETTRKLRGGDFKRLNEDVN